MATSSNHLLDYSRRCLEQGYEELAEVLINNAYKLDSSVPAVRESLRDVNERLVRRWHFLMLNDLARNSAFNNAIGEAVRNLDKDAVVLDIGSGTGILSLMAAKAGANRVYGCDTSRVMIRISHDVIAANLMQDKITLLHMLSTDIVIPRDIPERVSLVVMEIFDAGLLGEFVIPSLRHAWKELIALRKGVASVIPCGSTVYISAIECYEVRRKSRLLNPVLSALFETKGYQVVGSCNMAKDSCQLCEEPYTTEDLSNIKGGVAYLTPPVPTLVFDFTDHEVTLPQCMSVDVPAVQSGCVDAIAVWYDLHLDSTRTISTAPMSSTNWEHSIYPIEHESILLEDGETLTVDISCTDTNLLLNIVGKNAADSPFACNSDILYIERSDLCTLNDTVFVETLISTINASLVLLMDEEDLRIIEISAEGLSVAGLLASHVASDRDDVFIVVVCSEVYQSHLQTLSPSEERVKFICSVPPTLINTTWDVIVVSDVVTPQGLLSHKSLIAITNIDVTDSVLIPYCVEVVLMGVASPEMRARSCVLGSVPTLGFDIAKHINKYKITHLTDIDLDTLNYTQVTESTTVHKFDLSRPPNVTKTVTLSCVVDSSLTAVVYWFVLHLDSNHKLSTRPNIASRENHWHQAAFLAPEDVVIHQKQSIDLNFKLMDGFMDISF